MENIAYRKQHSSCQRLMERSALGAKNIRGNYKVIDDKYVVSMQRCNNWYKMFFESNEHEAFMKNDPTKLLTCFMISKPKMMKDNYHGSRNLSIDECNRFMVQKVKQLLKFVNDLNHECILKILFVCSSAANIYIFVERYQTLADYVGKRGPLKIKQIITMSEGLVSALSYLSSKNIASARINPKYLVVHQGKIKMNFLCFIKHHNIEDLSVNLARAFHQDTELFFCSPQALTNSTYSSKCDVWSLGVLFYYLLSKKLMVKHLHNIMNTQFLLNQIKKAIQSTEESLRPLISRMLVFEEEARASISEVEQIFQLLSCKDDQSNHLKGHESSKFDNM